MLALPICRDARLVAPGPEGVRPGRADLSRRVELAHVIDVPEAERWVGAQTLVLTTGLSWPRGGAALREVGERLARKQPAAVMLAVPGPFRAFPAEVAGALSAAGIPALTLPYEVPFVQVVQAVQQERVREQSALLLRSEAIHRALTQAALNGGLDDVVQTLAHHLGRPVAMVDANGEVLRFEGSGGVSVGGVGLPSAAPPLAATARRMLERPGSAPRRVSGKGSGAGGLLAPVMLRGQRVAGLWIAPEAGADVHADGPASVPTDSAPSDRVLDDLAVRHAVPAGVQAADFQTSDFAADLERRSIEHACTVAALLLLAQRELEARERQLGYAFVDTLLEGRFVPEPLSLERARRLGFDEQGVYTVGLLSLSGPLPLSLDGVSRRERLAGQVRDTLLALGSVALGSASPGPVSPWATSSGAAKSVALLSVGLNQVCFLLPHSGPGAQFGSATQSGKLASVHPAAPLRASPPERFWALLGPELRADVGLVYSRPRQGAQGVALSRAEVLALAPHTVIGEIRGFAELLLPRALSGDVAAQQQLIAATLGPLHAARGGENLINTLRILSACGWAQARAAALLGVHPNTLRYRMGRAEQLTSRALADPEVRSLWWLVFQLERLQGPEAGLP